MKLPGEITTPSEFIRERIEVLGWAQADLAYALGVTTSTVNQLISGKRGITGNMAKALGQALGIDPVALVKLQAEYEIESANEPDPIVTSRARILSKYPLRDMLKRGWIEDTKDPNKLEQGICKFFGAETLNQVPHLSHAAKRLPVETIPPSQLAWLFRVQQIAKEMPAPMFSKIRLIEAIDQMKQYLGNREEIRYVPKLLQDAGIRYVVVEGLPGSKIDGVCFWLDAKSPVIGMALRFDRIDNFWFVLRHECAHVLHGHGHDVAVVDAELEEREHGEEEKEQIANAEAADFCVPQAKMDSFYLRKNPFFSERDIVAFATILKVHPGLVVGQLHKRVGRYNFLRRYLVPVRDQIEGDAMIDGWGHFVPVS